MQTVWTVINLPAEALPNDPLGRQPGEMLWGDDGYARDLTAHGALHRIGARAVQEPVALTNAQAANSESARGIAEVL